MQDLTTLVKKVGNAHKSRQMQSNDQLYHITTLSSGIEVILVQLHE